MANPDFDERLTTTLNNTRGKIVDNLFRARPLAYFIKESGSVKLSGGDRIVRAVRFKKNNTVMNYEGADILNTNLPDGPTSAAYDWKQTSASVVIDGITKARNAGPEQIISILDDRVSVAEESLIEHFNTMWWGDGATDAAGNPDPKAWNGLGNLVIDETAVVGGIDPASPDQLDAAGNPLWAPKKDATGGVLTYEKLAPIFNSAAVGNDMTNVHLTTQDLFEKYESLLQPNLRYEDELTANAGFLNLRYKNVPVTYDEDCPDGHWLMLNTKYIQAFFHEDAMMKATPFIRPNNQDVMISQILTYGNLITTNRQRQGVLTGLTV